MCHKGPVSLAHNVFRFMSFSELSSSFEVEVGTAQHSADYEPYGRNSIPVGVTNIFFLSPSPFQIMGPAQRSVQRVQANSWTRGRIGRKVCPRYCSSDGLSLHKIPVKSVVSSD